MARQSHTGNARRHKSPGRRKKAAARLEFVQDYIPLKEIRNGIVETTDGRYLKILEIEPINFLLRSNEEQWGIWRRPSSIHAVLRLSSLLELGRVLLRWLL